MGAGFTIIELLSVMVIIGVLASLAVPRFSATIEKARIARAIGDLRALTTDLLSADSLPTSLAGIGRDNMLDPWGNPYQYIKFPPPKKGKIDPPPGARKDRFLVPINSLFDLYSMGKDGSSVPPLTGKASKDDIIVANDGGYIGLAKNY